jgi:hypothetical protein
VQSPPAEPPVASPSPRRVTLADPMTPPAATAAAGAGTGAGTPRFVTAGGMASPRDFRRASVASLGARADA